MVVRRFEGEPTTLVWIHGLGEQAASFEPIVRHPRLAAYTHVVPDLAGYGRSVADATLGSLARRAQALAAWLRELPPAVVVGHSMGGVLAILVAEQLAVRGLIDVEGNLSRGDCTFSARALAAGRVAFRTHGFAALRDEMLASSDPALRGYGVAISQTSDATFYSDAEDLVRLAVAEELAPRLAALACPSLFISGSPGGICERSQQLLAAHAIPHVRIAPSGHWPFLDQPDAFATAVANFVASVA